MSQQFCLKWNNHMNNMMDVFKNLLSIEAMVDVTLACDGMSLKAHKVVLSACSPFFQSLFLENPCKHPIVILKDMKYSELKAIIEFMYHGEVNVAQDKLSALMKTAETLKVKGLAEVPNEKNQSDDESYKSVPRTDTPPPKRRKGRTRKRSVSNQSDDTISEPKTKQPDSDIEELSSDIDNKTAYSTASTVPLQSRTNSFNKSQQVQQQPVEESFASEENYSTEPPKFLQQSLTADDLPRRSGRSSVQSNIELPRRSQSSTDHSSFAPVTSTPMSSNALVVANEQPESPPDIKPEILDLEPMSEPPMSPAAGPSHGTDENSMMYMDQSNMSSMSLPGSFQDDSALVSTDTQPQGFQHNNKKRIFTSAEFFTDSKKTNCKENPLGRFSCNFCSYVTNVKCNIKRHSYTHSGERPYKCEVCKKCFFQSTTLKYHMQIHTGKKAHTCEVCKKCFVYAKSLKSHMLIHTGEKPYRCEICEKCFSQISGLQYHMRIHTGEKPYRCEICEKRFSQKNTLQYHIRIHTGEKPYSCEICNKSYRSSSMLKKHMLNHLK